MSEVADTWFSRELPILRVVARRLDAGGEFIPFEEIGAETGLATKQVFLGVQALLQAEPPFILRAHMRTTGAVESIGERGRRAAGSWPSADQVIDQLAAELREAADRTDDSEKKSRLRATADGLVGMAKDVAVAYMAGRLGG